MNEMNLIDSLQAQLPVQYAWNINFFQFLHITYKTVLFPKL